jgi:hypothetical protein
MTTSTSGVMRGVPYPGPTSTLLTFAFGSPTQRIAFYLSRELSERGLRDGHDAGTHVRVLAALNPDRTKFAHDREVRPHRVHMIVIAPDDHIVLLNVLGLEFVQRVCGEVLGLVAIVPPCVLVRDHHVQSRRVGALKHVEGHHHRGGDAFDR